MSNPKILSGFEKEINPINTKTRKNDNNEYKFSINSKQIILIYENCNVDIKLFKTILENRISIHKYIIIEINKSIICYIYLDKKLVTKSENVANIKIDNIIYMPKIIGCKSKRIVLKYIIDNPFISYITNFEKIEIFTAIIRLKKDLKQMKRNEDKIKNLST